MKRPAFMFYPSDWRSDTELRVCSIAARGLWIDMLALMHAGEPYGHLTVDGATVSDSQLARLVGESPSLIKRLLKELEAHGVFSRTEQGVIYSRRMVIDEQKREVRAAFGKLSMHHPLVPRPKDTRKDTLPPSFGGSPSVAVAGAVSGTTTTPTPPRAHEDVPSGAPPAKPLGAVAAHFTAEHHRAAYVRAIGTRAQAAVDYELRLLAEGGERPSTGTVKAHGWPMVGEALHQLGAAGREFSSLNMVIFLRTLETPPESRSSAPVVGAGAQTPYRDGDKLRAKADEIVARRNAQAAGKAGVS